MLGLVLTPLAIVLALLGGAWGLVADRLAARWPAHVHEHVHGHDDPDHVHAHLPGDEPDPARPWAHEHPHDHRPDLEHGRVSIRRADWRTAAVTVIGALALGGVGLRFPEAPASLLFGPYAAVLVLLLATDLDQRILPDVVTLPIVPIAVVVALADANPLLPPGGLPIAALLAVVIPVLLYAFSIPFARGAFGLGDVKLLLAAGLVLGALRLVYAVVVGVFVAGVVLVVLLAARRITLKTFVPYGPFLILGVLWALLVIR